MDQTQEEKEKKNKMFYFTIILLILFVGYMVAKESGYITETNNKSIEKSKIEIQIGIQKVGNVSGDTSRYNSSTNITINRTINISR